MSEDKLTKWLSEKLLGHADASAKAPVPAPLASKAKHEQGVPTKQVQHSHSVPPKHHNSTRVPDVRHPAPRGGNHRPMPNSMATRGTSPAVHANKGSASGVVRIMALGGLDEVGRNSMIFEYERDILIVDLGFQFCGNLLVGIQT